MKTNIKWVIIIVCSILSSCKSQSQLFSLYFSFWNDYTTLLINKETNEFVLSNGEWSCVGKQEMKGIDTLMLYINELCLPNNMSEKYNMSCFLIYVQKGNYLLDITEKYFDINKDLSFLKNNIILPETLYKLPILETKDEKIWLKYGAVIN